MNVKTAGLRPAPHELFEKSSTKTLLKSREARFLIIFAPLFLKSGWGFGGEAPNILFYLDKNYISGLAGESVLGK